MPLNTRSLGHHIPMNGYPSGQRYDMVRRMMFWSSIGRAFLVLALIGLVAAPMAASAAAPVMTAEAMASMPDGMPCCPDQQRAVPDCAKGCPLVVLCTTSLVSIFGSVTPGLLSRLAVDADFHGSRDVALSSLVGEPPPKPPKA
ncbi:hypothetical protein QEZ47_27410 [Aminobacter anthyllidis]|uniref:hypothetical protein n=1 Tax=Aminobacter anthyllidis TaxID=1035067 RepID=UPI002456168D|nr:hypothetical protein [Aminobacter anthyllidis]MDH4989167.1 hypothetical protein [Aminobacter anthyllidis]